QVGRVKPLSEPTMDPPLATVCEVYTADSTRCGAAARSGDSIVPSHGRPAIASWSPLPGDDDRSTMSSASLTVYTPMVSCRPGASLGSSAPAPRAQGSNLYGGGSFCAWTRF